MASKPVETKAATAADPAPSENQVALAQGQRQSVAPVMDDMEAFAGAGMEKVTARDVLIPRLGMIQALSDQVKKRNSLYIEGAEIGDICDLGTNELMERPIMVIPVVYDKVWIEWYPRSTGKGLAAIHPTDEAMATTTLNDKNQNILPNLNILAETAQLYVLNGSAGWRPSFIPFTSTQLKKAKRWMTLAQGERLQRKDGTEYVPPLFYRAYMLDTAMESNAQGEWAGWTVSRAASLPELHNWRNIMDAAVAFQKALAAGQMKADTSSMTSDPSEVVIDSEGNVKPHEGRM